MKIAIISDIHGNLEALKTTFKDIERRNVDQIICLGDIIMKGVHSRECVQLIREKCDIILRGNCDRHFSQEHKDIDQLPEEERKRIEWMNKTLAKEDKEYLYSLPYSYEFYMSGSLVRLFHATPEVDNKAVLNLDNIETKLKMFYPSPNTISQSIADVVIYGHIHHPYLDRLYNKTLINVGSVGNSFDAIRNPEKDSNVLGTTQINYLIIEGELGSKEYNSGISYQFIRLPYNIEKELEDEYLNIEKENYRFEIIEGKYRNMTKINEYYKSIGIDPDKI